MEYFRPAWPFSLQLLSPVHTVISETFVIIYELLPSSFAPLDHCTPTYIFLKHNVNAGLKDKQCIGAKISRSNYLQTPMSTG